MVSSGGSSAGPNGQAPPSIYYQGVYSGRETTNF